MYVISATQSLFGAFAVNLRSTRSGAGRASRSLTVVRTPLRRLAPTRFRSFINRTSRSLLRGYALVFEFSLDTRSPVGAARTPMNRFDSIAELNIALPAFRRRPMEPRIVAAGGDAQRAAHRGDAKLGLVALHESEDFFGITSISRANQAAAFDKISFSTVSRLISRRSFESSTRSSFEC